jgi:hypothetical protein
MMVIVKVLNFEKRWIAKCNKCGGALEIFSEQAFFEG